MWGVYLEREGLGSRMGIYRIVTESFGMEKNRYNKTGRLRVNM